MTEKTKQMSIYAKPDEVNKIEFIKENSECSNNSAVLRKAVHVLYLQVKSNIESENSQTERDG
ncbi:hypothetical protein AAEX28_13405 [Lentisphaerota bacterium WC36G]|nr:hypothetical protein LJT99_00160 [Lentisphaerae bacterium WC36]